MAFTPYSAQAWNFPSPFNEPVEESTTWDAEPRTLTWRAAGVGVSQTVRILTKTTTTVYTRDDIAYNGGSVADIPSTAKTQVVGTFNLGEGLLATTFKYIRSESETSYEFTPDDRAGRATLTKTIVNITREVIRDGSVS